jgi:hypothetical protein
MGLADTVAVSSNREKSNCMGRSVDGSRIIIHNYSSILAAATMCLSCCIAVFMDLAISKSENCQQYLKDQRVKIAFHFFLKLQDS